MSDIETRFHETWIGMVQPIEGLVVSVPVLVEAQCMHRHAPSFQQAFLEVCPPPRDAPAGPRRIVDLPAFLDAVLSWTSDLYDAGEVLPVDLSLYVPEGKQTLRPTLALKRQGRPPDARESGSDTPAAKAGSSYVALLWDVPDGLNLDKPEAVTGPWEYPPAAKFDRLLRQCRVPIGLLTNRRELRLFYAPHGESSGVLCFRVDDMASVGGRPILDAFVMLLSAHRFFGALAEQQLPAILSESRKRQVNVTNQLADQVFEALGILLRGFEAAGERDPRYASLLREALERGDDHLYGGLLTVLLRLVFVLYAEDRGLLPTENGFYGESFSLLALFDELQHDHGAYPDSMSRRFGAWPRLLSLFRAIFLGCEHDEMKMPQRRGELFDPHVYAFLEGWGPAGSAPITLAEDRAAVAVPTVDDESIFRVLQRLILLEGQRLSYRALDVEQIGSVYEALMGYHVRRVEAPSVCLRPERAKAVWVSVVEALAQKKAQRAKWLKEDVGLSKSHAEKIARALEGASSEVEGLPILEGFRVRHTESARVGALVIQPGSERRRTSSHYTPRSLSAPIVEKTLAPLIRVMGDAPSSESLLNLTICDPAMGSGAFLVEACRYLADEVVAAWTREQRLDRIADEHEDVVNHARRLVAQRCLYGVDKNRFAVNLAKLSLWLVTLAKDEPFTFVDHALRCGDSLVGLDFEQIRSFHWAPGKQVETCRVALGAALDEAITLRQQILDLAGSGDEGATKEKYRLLRDAEDALEPARLIGDLVVGAFFAASKDKDRQKERDRRLALVEAWLASGGPPTEELLGLQQEIRARLPVFHWMTEFPEVFYAERPDPLDAERRNQAAFMDAFVGNPPFAGKNNISAANLDGYPAWLQSIHAGAHGNADLSAHFLRRAGNLLGANGAIGFIATNTVSQGDTRTTGLGHLIQSGYRIYSADEGLPWPGDAAVRISTVHLAYGSVAVSLDTARLNGKLVVTINSRLRPILERPDPESLRSNHAFGGVFILGEGFLLQPEDRNELIREDARNAEIIRPYLGGADLNTSPRQEASRYVINFGEMTRPEAERWPTLFRIIEEKVRGGRQHVTQRDRRELWWLFATRAPEVGEFLARAPRAIATAQTGGHRAFSFVYPETTLANTLVVILAAEFSTFCVVQSRIHDAWVCLLSSSLKEDVRYTPSDCFDNYPFPQPDPRIVIPTLEDIGGRLYETRAKYMVDTDQGLTQTYNQLKNPSCTPPRIVELRELHLEMDRAVLAAYGWGAGSEHPIEVPPYTTPTTPEEEKALETFQDEVIDRLFVLNAERAQQEKLAGASTKKTKGKTKPKASTRRKKSDDAPKLPGIDDEDP